MSQNQDQQSEQGFGMVRGVLVYLIGVIGLHVLVQFGSITVPFDRLALAAFLVAGLLGTVIGADRRELDGGVLAVLGGVAGLTVTLIGSGVGFIGFPVPMRELVLFETILLAVAGAVVGRVD